MAEMKVPEIRFKGFVDEWAIDPLHQVANVNPPGVMPETFEYVDLASVVGTEMVAHRTEQRDTAPSRAQRVAEVGDIFYQTVRPYQKNNHLFEKPNAAYVFSTGYAQLRPSVQSDMLFAALHREEFVKNVLDRCTGTSFPAIAPSDLRDILISTPTTRNEQQRIGSLFSELDALTAGHRKKLAKLQQTKTSLLQKMFPQGDADEPELRLNGFSGAWGRSTLGEEVSVIGGGTPSTHNAAFWGGHIDWYTPSEIGDTPVAPRSRLKITAEGLARSSTRLLPANKTVLFTSRASIGHSAILHHEAATNQGFQSFVVGSSTDVHFIYALTSYIKSYALRRASGSTFLEVSASSLREMPLMRPDLYEQRAIGAIFSELGDLIVGEQQYIEKLKQAKKSLLQKMFV